MNLMLGDCLEQLKNLPDNSVDSIVTDPPYGLSFMGKAWDYDVPGQNIWAECLRVLKPGGHLLSFSGTRTYHRMVVKIEDAGFEIRDQIQWIYGSGFPKSHNLKEEWQGWGTALKPANEPIVVARKPLEKGLTVAQNVLKWGTGALNIDGSRIGTDKISTHGGGDKLSGIKGNGNSGIGEYREHVGRWPANIIFDEEAAKALDEQVKTTMPGMHSAGKARASNRDTNSDAKDMFPMHGKGGHRFDDTSTGASRFFYVAKASKAERNAGLEGMPEVEKKTLGEYVNPSEGRTASKSGSSQQNFHPTVKPLKLGTYLQNLVTPPGGVTLDPFMGSGSFGVSAKAAGFQFIGIERDPQYFEIAKKRIESAQISIDSSKEDDSQLEFPA